jgi:leucyl-tRNA synthetase
MFIHDLGLIDFEEPFSKFFAHGLLIKDGAKMSKSKGNVIVPDAYVNKYGADTMRAYLMFLAPLSQGGDFSDAGVEGISRFLNRVWNLFGKIGITDKETDKETLKMINKTIKAVTEDIERFSYNTAIAKLMEFYNFISQKSQVGEEVMIDYLRLLAPFAPFISEEIYQSLKSSAKSIHISDWPKHQEDLLKEEEQIIVVQINGKTRDTIVVESSKVRNQKEIEEMARQGKAKSFLEGRNIMKTIYVEGKIVNFVVSQ